MQETYAVIKTKLVGTFKAVLSGLLWAFIASELMSASPPQYASRQYFGMSAFGDLPLT